MLTPDRVLVSGQLVQLVAARLQVRHETSQAMQVPALSKDLILQRQAPEIRVRVAPHELQLAAEFTQVRHVEAQAAHVATALSKNPVLHGHVFVERVLVVGQVRHLLLLAWQVAQV